MSEQLLGTDPQAFLARRDLREATQTLGADEIRYMVDTYYLLQEYRKRSANQNRALTASGEPHSLVEWAGERFHLVEKQIKKALEVWCEQNEFAQWCLSIHGIGPVITAGLIAHIDLEKATTAGKIWRYAGQDPTSKWEKGQKRPWNACRS